MSLTMWIVIVAAAVLILLVVLLLARRKKGPKAAEDAAATVPAEPAVGPMATGPEVGLNETANEEPVVPQPPEPPANL